MPQTHPRLFIKGNSQNLSYRYTFEWHIIKNQLQKCVPSSQDSDIGKILFESENLNLKISFLGSNFPKNSRQKRISRNISIYNPITFLLAQDWGDLRHNHLLLSKGATLSKHLDLVLSGNSWFMVDFLHLIQEHQLQSKQQINTRQICAILHLKITPMYIHLNVDKTQHWSSFPRSARASHAYLGDA